MLQAIRALHQLREGGAPLECVLLSSDSFGSLPVFDTSGRLVKYEVGKEYQLGRDGE